MSDAEDVAEEGKEYEFRDDRGQVWTLSWHPPELPPPGGRWHGSGGICFTPDGSVVLVTQPGGGWELPAGRPEGDEDWQATLVREVLEEACAVVQEATLLGFVRSVCLKGGEEGLVLVRALWRAEVVLNPWEPRHETVGRRLAPPEEALDQALGGAASGPIHQRWLREALASRQEWGVQEAQA